MSEERDESAKIPPEAPVAGSPPGDSEASTSDEALERLRALVYAEPSAEAYARLVEAVDACPQDALDVAVDYVASHVAAWPLVDAAQRPPIERLFREAFWMEVFANDTALGGLPLKWRASFRASPQGARYGIVRGLFPWTPMEPWTSAQVRDALRSGHLGGLRWLRVVNCALEDDAWDALVQAEGLARVERLTLVRCNLDSARAARLGQSEALPGLRCLQLIEASLDRRGLRSLLTGPLRRRLEVVELTQCGLRGLDMSALEGALEGLKGLRIARAWLDTAGALMLGQALDRDTLEYLDVSRCRLSAQQAMGLLRGGAWAALESLDLQETRLHRKIATVLCEAPPTLRRLHLEDTWLGSEGAEALARLDALSNITHLTLARNALRAEALKTALSGALGPNLRWLDLSHNAFGDEGVAWLAQHDQLERVAWIDLRGTGAWNLGARALARTDKLPALRGVLFDRLDTASVEALAARGVACICVM